MYVYSLIARERIKQFAPDFARLFLETGKRFWIGQNSENCSEFSSSETKHDKG